MIADGFDVALVTSLKTAAKKAGANFKLIAPKVGGAVAKNGTLFEVDFQLAGGPSVLFDTVFVALSGAGGKMLAKEAAAVAWVHDAFSHLKVIGATPGAQPLLDAAGVAVDSGILIAATAKVYLTTAAKGRIWEREPKVRTIY